MSSFDLVETMPFDPRDGIINLERHLAHMKASAEALGFPFDRHDARNELQAATFRSREPRMVRLMLSPSGAIAIESRDLPPPPHEPVSVAIAPLPLEAQDMRLWHKTTDNGPLDEARRAAGTYEILFTDDRGMLLRGSFTTVFIERDGMLLTPPMPGAAPGSVMREQLIADGHACEAELRREDIRPGFILGNAVIGLVAARLAE
jgi:para-aminobenzoate synthetase/4-amino-4-deoxychorismate lyase